MRPCGPPDIKAHRFHANRRAASRIPAIAMQSLQDQMALMRRMNALAISVVVLGALVFGAVVA
jgi:hypothetical protein